MPIGTKTHEIDIDKIIIDRLRRQRQEFTVEDLKPSIEKNGLINAIVVEQGSMMLVAGERRLTACKELGHKTIPVRFAVDVDEIDLQILEHEENVKRKDLTWDENCAAVTKIHQLYLKRDPEWTIGETANALGLTIGWVSQLLKVSNEIASGNAKIAEAKTVSEALNVIKRKELRQAAKDLEELLDSSPATNPPPKPLPVASVSGTVNVGDAIVVDGKPEPAVAVVPEPPVLNQSFLDWAPNYSGPKFNFIHCDFPYGVNLFTGGKFSPQQDGTYDDSKDVYFALLDCFVKNLDNFCSLSAHFIFWYSNEHRDATMAIFRNHAPSIEWVRDPLIWGKTDNAGIAKDMRRHPRHCHENALFGFRSRRVLVGQKSDFYPGPTANQLHPSAKPIPMLKHFFSMVVDEQTRMLDPTCGSGTALCAADALGASHVFGLDIDSQHCETASTQLSNQRKLTQASKKY